MNTFGGDTDDDVTDWDYLRWIWGQENVEQSERDLDAAIDAARTTPDEVHDALIGMIGLVRSLVARLDCPDDVRLAALQDQRYIDARHVAKSYL